MLGQHPSIWSEEKKRSRNQIWRAYKKKTQVGQQRTQTRTMSSTACIVLQMTIVLTVGCKLAMNQPWNLRYEPSCLAAASITTPLQSDFSEFSKMPSLQKNPRWNLTCTPGQVHLLGSLLPLPTGTITFPTHTSHPNKNINHFQKKSRVYSAQKERMGVTIMTHQPY